MARQDEAGVRLVTENDFTRQIAAAVAALPVRSCLIDGEAIVRDENGLANPASADQRHGRPVRF